jgi:hypothetical protein
MSLLATILAAVSLVAITGAYIVHYILHSSGGLHDEWFIYGPLAVLPSWSCLVGTWLGRHSRDRVTKFILAGSAGLLLAVSASILASGIAEYVEVSRSGIRPGISFGLLSIFAVLILQYPFGFVALAQGLSNLDFRGPTHE